MAPPSPATPPLHGYTLQDVNFGRLYKAATQTSKRLLKEVFLVMVQRCRVAEVAEWPATVTDCCLHLLGWSKKRFRDSFQAEERNLLQQPFDSADFDVSLLTKMIHKMFLELNLPESFSRAIRDLKNVRNRVCHEHQLLDDEQLNDNLNDLKVIYDRLLSETAEYFSVEVGGLQKTFRGEIDDILASSVTMDASDYFEKVEQFRVEVVGRFITLARRELITYYSKLKVLNPFTWLNDERFPELQVGKIFTPLLITERGMRSVDAAMLLSTEKLSEKEEEGPGELPAVLTLSGIAGCGKTSLCRFLLHDWRTKEGAVDTLRAVDILVYIEARSVTSGALVPYLQKTLLPDTCAQFDECGILQALRQVTVLYVIDGMDEATNEGRQLVAEVFSALGGSRVIVTTRPEFTGAVTQLAERHHLSCMTMAIHGFSFEGMKEFTARVFASIVPAKDLRRKQKSAFLKFLRTSCLGLGDHLKLPLTLALLICLWKDDQSHLSEVTSATKLYFEIFRLCTSKMASRLQASCTVHQLDLQSFMERWLLRLGREAYQMLEEDHFVITADRRKHLVAMCLEHNIDSIQVFSAFLQCEVRESVLGLEHHFSFVHKSQMEYLAAMYLSHELAEVADSNKSSITSRLKNFKIFKSSSFKSNTVPDLQTNVFSGMTSRKWVNTKLFVVGHLCQGRAAEEVLRSVVEVVLNSRTLTNQPATMWRLVKESGLHPLVCTLVGEKVNPKYVWQPDAEELCDSSNPVFQLIKHTSFTPFAVYLRVVGSVQGARVVGEDGRVEHKPYEVLKPVLACLAQRPAAKVILRLDQQYFTWGDANTADHLLKCLEPKVNVTAFMGHLGPAGAVSLARSPRLGELCVRVSEAATLHALAASLLKSKGTMHKLVLRLDLPPALPPSAVPALPHPAEVDVFLWGVEDASAARAAEVLAQLRSEFLEVDLVAARLTPAGGGTFVNTLRARHVEVKSLTVRSTHPLGEDAHHSLAQQLSSGTLSWWS